MNRLLKIFSIIIFVSIHLLTGCGDSAGSANGDIEIRAILESEGSSSVDFRIYVEGSDGNALTGSVVLVSDSISRVTNLEFDPDTYCYTGSANISPDGMFNIRVDSNAVDGAQTITVPHTVLSLKPVVTTFQDADGNSVLSGQSLISASPIQIAWKSAGTGVVYQVTIKTALSTVYAVSTGACNISIGASKIPAGTDYYLDIVAQKIYGDLYFITDNYYSVSVIRSASVYFDVQ